MLIDSFVVFFLLHGPFEASFYEITVLPEDIKRMEWNGVVRWSSLPVIIYAFIARKTAETMFQHYLSPGGVKDFFSVGGGGKGKHMVFRGGTD